MIRVHINEAALARVVESDEMREALREAGNAIADNVRGMGITVGDIDGGSWEIPLPVSVSKEDPVKVSLSHPAGIAVQAKHGALTSGAAAAGLEVTG